MGDVFSKGPLNGFFFRFANTKPPGLFDTGLPHGVPSLKAFGGCLTTRMLFGKEPRVGVAGRTFTEWCGLRLVSETFVLSEPEPLEEIDEALEWLW